MFCIYTCSVYIEGFIKISKALCSVYIEGFIKVSKALCSVYREGFIKYVKYCKALFCIYIYILYI